MQSKQKNTMKSLLTTLVLALLIAGCAGVQSPMDDGYQFGDLTATVVEAQARYCTSANPYQRAVALALLHKTGASIPERGACTDLREAIPDPELDGVDVEAARRDAERFRERE